MGSKREGWGEDGGSYAFTFGVLGSDMFVFVVPAGTNGCVENFEKGDFIGGGQSTCLSGFRKDTICVSSPFVGSRRMISQ